MIPTSGSAAWRRGTRISTWWLALASVVLATVVLLRLLVSLSRRFVALVLPALGRYLRWFWALSTAAKVVATMGEALGVAIVLPRLPLPLAIQTMFVYGLVLALIALLLVGLLFSGDAERRTAR